jgi:GGDEF domain-containing protein
MSPRSAERLVRAARAAQALSETLWEALHEELADPAQRRVAELSQRLADVSATVALLAQMDAGSPAAPEAHMPAAASESPAASETPVPAAGPESPVARVTPEQPPARREQPIAQESSSMAVLVDELAPREAPEIEIRDERGEHAPTAWIASIARLLERYERDRAPFAVLLVELADIERLRHAELPGEVSRLTGLVEAALSGELRPADSLTRESPGRYWLLAPETDSGGATALAERMASAVRGAASHRGASLQIAVGIAVCPLNGSQAVVLAAHADIALYAARASGRPVA